MSRGRQKISFEGLLQENVLGTFTVIRGFADLRDLNEVSVAMPYQSTSLGQGSGYAKSKGIPFILTFQKRNPDDKPPWDREASPGNKVHFDLTPYRYIPYETAYELRDKLKEELKAFIEHSI